jgi:hypothetical protein
LAALSQHLEPVDAVALFLSHLNIKAASSQPILRFWQDIGARQLDFYSLFLNYFLLNKFSLNKFSVINKKHWC